METVRYDLPITADGSGNFTGYITPMLCGLVMQVRVDDLKGAFDLTISLADTGVRVFAGTSLTGPIAWMPRHAIHDNDDGTELVHQDNGSADTFDIVGAPVAVAGESIKVVLAGASPGASATLSLWMAQGAGDYLAAEVGDWCHAGYTL